jgi:polar amino acid transport system substrate-binding protein
MRLRSVLLLVLAAMVPIGCSKGDSEALRVGIEAKYPPFESLNADGTFEGFDIDLARELGRSLGRPVEFHDMDWDSLIPSLQADRIDLICSGMSYTVDRAEIVDFTKPYAQSPMSVLVNVEAAKNVTKASDLDAPGVRFAVQRGTTGEKKARAAFPKAEFTVYDTENEAATEVGTGRAVAFVYDYLSVDKHAKRFPGKTRILDESLGAEDYCIAVVKGSPLRAEVDAALETAKKPGGALESLMKKWLPGAAEKLRAK